jgi:hypothetical protein
MTSAYEPEGQRVHAVEAESAEKAPAGQLAHALLLVAPRAVEKVPAGHRSVHVVFRPTADAYVPAEHRSHAPNNSPPWADLYVPAAQVPHHTMALRRGTSLPTGSNPAAVSVTGPV